MHSPAVVTLAVSQVAGTQKDSPISALALQIRKVLTIRLRFTVTASLVDAFEQAHRRGKRLAPRADPLHGLDCMLTNWNKFNIAEATDFGAGRPHCISSGGVNFPRGTVHVMAARARLKAQVALDPEEACRLTLLR